MNKNLVWLFVYIVIFALLLIVGTIIQEKLKIYMVTQVAPWGYKIFSSVLPIITGIYIGIPNLIKKTRMHGIWSIDKKKILVIVIPSLFIATLSISIFVLPINISLKLLPILKHNSFFYSSFGILAGYSLLESLFVAAYSE